MYRNMLHMVTCWTHGADSIYFCCIHQKVYIKKKKFPAEVENTKFISNVGFPEINHMLYAVKKYSTTKLDYN